MHPESHVARISAAVAAARSPREGHRSLTAAVMEELHVSTAKVSIRHAVEQIVETGLGQSEPGRVEEHARADPAEGIHADRQAERQPENDEHQVTVYVRLRKLVVPEESGRWLIASGGASHTQHQLHVEEDGHQSGQSDQHARTHRLFPRDASEPTATKVGTHVRGRLNGHYDRGNPSDRPESDDCGRYMTRLQIGVPWTLKRIDKQGTMYLITIKRKNILINVSY